MTVLIQDYSVCVEWLSRGKPMKYVKALIVVIRLIASPRYRKEWNQAIERLSDANDAAEASLRRLETRRNGDKPDLRIL